MCGIMNIKDKIIRLIMSPFPRRYVERRLVSKEDVLRRFSRGNWRLQLGRVMFDDEYQKIRKRVASYAF